MYIDDFNNTWKCYEGFLSDHELINLIIEISFHISMI